MDGAQAALDRALRRNKSDDRLEAAERAREETTEALERESAEAHRLVSDFEVELKKVDNLTKDADLWLSRPIKRCMAKLSELDTHNLNREQKDVLNLLVSCHRNLRMISTDIKALARFQRRTAKARACLERVLSAGEGATISRTNHSREASRAESLTLSICSEAADQVQGRHSILCAYMKLMRPPASERIVGALRDSFATRSPPFEEFDSLAHAWLEEWMHLTTILQAVFQVGRRTATPFAILSLLLTPSIFSSSLLPTGLRHDVSSVPESPEGMHEGRGSAREHFRALQLDMPAIFLGHAWDR